MKSVQEYSWGSGPLPSGEEETFYPSGRSSAACCYTWIAVTSYAVFPGTALPNCVMVGNSEMPEFPCLALRSAHPKPEFSGNTGTRAGTEARACRSTLVAKASLSLIRGEDSFVLLSVRSRWDGDRCLPGDTGAEGVWLERTPG